MSEERPVFFNRRPSYFLILDTNGLIMRQYTSSKKKSPGRWRKQGTTSYEENMAGSLDKNNIRRTTWHSLGFFSPFLLLTAHCTKRLSCSQASSLDDFARFGHMIVGAANGPGTTAVIVRSFFFFRRHRWWRHWRRPAKNDDQKNWPSVCALLYKSGWARAGPSAWYLFFLFPSRMCACVPCFFFFFFLTQKKTGRTDITVTNNFDGPLVQRNHQKEYGWPAKKRLGQSKSDLNDLKGKKTGNRFPPSFMIISLSVNRRLGCV